MDPNERGDKVSQLADYLQTRMKYAQDHRGWAIKFFLCEVLNFINVIAQIFITDAFIQGEFTTYGIEVNKTKKRTRLACPDTLMHKSSLLKSCHKTAYIRIA